MGILSMIFRNYKLHGCRDGSVETFKILNRKDKQTNKDKDFGGTLSFPLVSH